MYSIQFSDWGLVLDFFGKIQYEVVADWRADMQQLTGGFSEPFSVVVDLQKSRPASREVEEHLLGGLRLLAQAGMERVAVVLDETGNALWPRLSAAEEPPGIRQIVARPNTEWLTRVHAWTQRGLEPQSSEASEWNGS